MSNITGTEKTWTGSTYTVEMSQSIVDKLNKALDETPKWRIFKRRTIKGRLKFWEGGL